MPNNRLPRPRKVAEGLHPQALDTIQMPTLEASDVNLDISIKDFEYIGSYNWINSQSPTILVPGSPPRWLDKKPPFTIPHDKGIQYIDQNGFRMLSMPLSPLVQAVDFVSKVDNLPPTQWSSIDFVTDRRNLRKLLRWIDGRSHGRRAVRIDTQLAGEKTVLFSGWEEKTRERAQDTSWGHSFETFSTAPAAGCPATSGHHRIVKYRFGGLLMVVRFEVDAFDPIATKAGAGELTDHQKSIRLTDRVPSRQKAKNLRYKGGVGLEITHGGSIPQHSSIIELKSTSEKSFRKDRQLELYSQLYISQTPWVYKAIHNQGAFHTIERKALTSLDMDGAAERSKSSLQKLILALHVIHKVVGSSGRDGRLSLVLRNGELQVFKRTTQSSCLPKEVMARFDV